MNRLILVAGSVFLLIFLGMIILFRGGGQAPVTTAQKVMPLPDYSDTNAEVSLTIDGRINGQDQHRAIRITVDQYQRRLDVLNGYNGNVLKTKSFKNSEKAYDIFLRAIRDSGFLVENKSATIKDERGRCPLGFRYIFELNDGGEQLSRLWSASCSKMGTLGGNSSLLQSLFKAQITDYFDQVSDVRL